MKRALVSLFLVSCGSGAPRTLHVPPAPSASSAPPSAAAPSFRGLRVRFEGLRAVPERMIDASCAS